MFTFMQVLQAARHSCFKFIEGEDDGLVNIATDAVLVGVAAVVHEQGAGWCLCLVHSMVSRGLSRL